MHERHQHAGDEQEQPKVEGDRGDQLQRADPHHRLARRRQMGERRIAEEHREDPDGQRDQQPARRDHGRVPEDRQAALRALAAERDVPQRDRERDDHAGAEAVADVGVALDDERQRHHQRRPQQPRRDDLDDHAHHHCLPWRSRPATPTIAAASTVISTIVSNPRKSARITVTTSPPWASGVRRMCSMASLLDRSRARERGPDRHERGRTGDHRGCGVSAGAAVSRGRSARPRELPACARTPRRTRASRPSRRARRRAPRPVRR